MLSRLRSLAGRGLATAFPASCAVCDHRGAWLCDICRHDMTPLVPDLCCDRCGHPVLGGRCGCRDMHPVIGKLRSIAAYDGWLQQAIQRTKYAREYERAEHLAALMQPHIEHLPHVDALIPVPLHHTREQDRGFNQAQKLAEYLGAALDIPVLNGLQRTRDTGHQTSMTREERIDNMKGAFDMASGFIPTVNRTYVLIDDVYTTGATIGACAEVLESGGVDMVYALTAALDLKPADLTIYREVISGLSV